MSFGQDDNDGCRKCDEPSPDTAMNTRERLQAVMSFEPFDWLPLVELANLTPPQMRQRTSALRILCT